MTEENQSSDIRWCGCFNALKWDKKGQPYNCKRWVNYKCGTCKMYYAYKAGMRDAFYYMEASLNGLKKKDGQVLHKNYQEELK